MIDDGGPSPTDEKSAWLQPGFIAAAAIVTLVILLGLILALTGGSDGDAGTKSANPAPAAPAAPAGHNANASVCGLEAGSQSIPDAAPKAAWKLRGTVAVPSAPGTFGPHETTDGVPSCFAHSPTGALFATTNIYAALSVASHGSVDEQIAALKAMAAPGPGLDAATARRGGNRPSADSSSGVQVAGFNVVRYEPSSAVVDLAFHVDRAHVSGYVHATSTLRWQKGDWKVVLSQDGRPFDSLQQIDSLGGYVPWSGV
jgi:hypothetical protein